MIPDTRFSASRGALMQLETRKPRTVVSRNRIVWTLRSFSFAFLCCIVLKGALRSQEPPTVVAESVLFRTCEISSFPSKVRVELPTQIRGFETKVIVRVHNRSESDWVSLSTKSSCGCAVVKPVDGMELPSMGYVDFELKLLPNDRGRFEQAIDVVGSAVSGGERSNVCSLLLKGNVVDAVRVSRVGFSTEALLKRTAVSTILVGHEDVEILWKEISASDPSITPEVTSMVNVKYIDSVVSRSITDTINIMLRVPFLRKSMGSRYVAEIPITFSPSPTIRLIPRHLLIGKDDQEAKQVIAITDGRWTNGERPFGHRYSLRLGCLKMPGEESEVDIKTVEFEDKSPSLTIARFELPLPLNGPCERRYLRVYESTSMSQPSSVFVVEIPVQIQ